MLPRRSGRERSRRGQVRTGRPGLSTGLVRGAGGGLGRGPELATTVGRVSNGDGWTYCALGHRHWGLFGAAGLLVVRDGQVLLQLRAVRVHNGGTWSVPGGARHPEETPVEAALRESWEETGLPPSAVQPREVFVDDHGGWSYTTVVAGLLTAFEARNNYESEELRWVEWDAVAAPPLHDGFARSWPDLLTILHAAPTAPAPTPGVDQLRRQG